MNPPSDKSPLSRRTFVQLSAWNALALMACRKVPTGSLSAPGTVGPPEPRFMDFGPLAANPQAILELPMGFHCAVVQQFHDPMTCGNRMPAQPDGMTCHIDEQGNYVLLRNHEMGDGDWMAKPGRAFPTNYFKDERHPDQAYDNTMYGGVSRVVIDPTQLLTVMPTGDARAAVKSSNLVLAGTQFNCSGGHVPEGWVSCEETDNAGHGYAFLTKVDDAALVDPNARRITSWGRLKREGVSLETDSGMVFMTEDHKNGCLYRFVPDHRREPMGPGTLQALVVDGATDTDPTTPLVAGSSWKTSWVEVADPQAKEQPCRKQAQSLGASRFNRCEGSVLVGSSLWFIASTAGPVGAGQVYRLDLKSGQLHLEVQVTDRAVLSMPDNLTITPWGDLLMAEDNYNADGGATHQYLRCLRPDGSVYDFGRNPNNTPDDCGAEMSGPCFSPDGKVLFVNIQTPVGITLAIHGPWQQA
jgi:secreted PhoX family phosphatase